MTLTKGFFMGAYTVTQEEWQAVMGNNPGHFRGERKLPVEGVSWDDCQEFIKRLRARDKKHYRRPTEAEWEYACRAGTTTAFSFGDSITTDKANYNGKHTYGDGKEGIDREKTTPVGTFAANPWGLYDMHGNVYQWCQDGISDYPSKDVSDPIGPDKGPLRILRGGSFYYAPGYCRSAYRHRGEQSTRYRNVGLRLCVSAD